MRLYGTTTERISHPFFSRIFFCPVSVCFFATLFTALALLVIVYLFHFFMRFNLPVEFSFFLSPLFLRFLRLVDTPCELQDVDFILLKENLMKSIQPNTLIPNYLFVLSIPFLYFRYSTSPYSQCFVSMRSLMSSSFISSSVLPIYRLYFG
jgi:hypothetical protein